MLTNPDALDLVPVPPNHPLNKSLAGLYSPGLLGRQPVIGVLMVLLGVILFGAMVINLQTTGPLIQVDRQVAATVHQAALQSTPFIRDTMIFGYYLGQHGVITIGVLLGLYFLFTRRWAELIMIVIAWIGEASLWIILSTYFNRSRPAFNVIVWHQVTAPGFPSGHSISAVMCFGLVAYFVVPTIRSNIGKVIGIVITIVMILFIGFSRIFLGDHYLTDVLAGYGFGLAWAGLVYTFIDLIAVRRRAARLLTLSARQVEP